MAKAKEEIERAAGRDEGAVARRWSFARCVLDERTLELSVDGSAMSLERKPLELLLYLLHHAGEVVTKDEILAAVWPGRILSDSVLTSTVARLREAIGDDGQAIIKTQYGYGYRLVAPVQVEAAPVAGPPRFDFKPGDSPPLRPRWRLEQQLGAGGHGEAWLARHEKTGEVRVYKFALDRTALVSLKREITIYRLLHEALPERSDFVNILDWNLEEPPYFLEIEHAGESLVHWAEHQGGLPEVPLETRLDLVAQVAEALAAAHSVGVLHKDLKPGNVLVTGPATAPRIKLCDFGSGGVLDPARLEALGITRLGFTRTAATDVTSGTPIYFAPEVVAGQPFTVQADVYAAGVMLYQLVVGDLKRPLATGWEREIADELIREDVAAATEGALLFRLTDAAALARRLKSLPERRRLRHAERARQVEFERSRATIDRLRSRRRWLVSLAVVLTVGVVISTAMYVTADRARAEATRSVEVTNAVVEFLTRDLLSVEDQRTGLPIKDISLRDVLDRGAEKINTRFGQAPEVAASLHFAIAMAYRSLGDAAGADKQTALANALHRETEGPVPDWQVLTLFLRWDRNAGFESFCSELEEALRRGVKKSVLAVPVIHVQTFGALCRVSRGQVEEGRQDAERLLASLLTVEPIDYAMAAQLENILAAISYFQGDIEAAEAFVAAEKGHKEKTYGPMHHQTIGARIQRLHPLALLGRFDEAETEIGDLQGLVPADHPDRQRFLEMVASLRYEQGRFAEAEKTTLQLIPVARDTGSDANPPVGHMLRLGEIYLAQKDGSRAATVLGEALAAYRPRENPLDALFDRAWLINVRSALAEALRLTGRPTEADEVLVEAQRLSASLPNRHPAMANLRRIQALLQHDRGKTDSARRAMREALEIYQYRFGDDNWRVRRAQSELVELEHRHERALRAATPA